MALAGASTGLSWAALPPFTHVEVVSCVPGPLTQIRSYVTSLQVTCLSLCHVAYWWSSENEHFELAESAVTLFEGGPYVYISLHGFHIF